MGLFDKLFKSNKVEEPKVELPAIADDVIVSLGDGELIDIGTVSDPMFAEQMMGKTIAFKLSDDVVCAPANGKVEVAFPTGHAFAIRMEDGTGLLVHIGVDTVSLDGKGFSMLLKVGDTVKAGQPCVKVDWSVVEKAGLDTSTMLIITEPVDTKTYDFIDPCTVEKYQQVSK